MKDENLLEAFTVWENMSHPPETRYAYLSRLKYMLDEEAKYIDTLARRRKEEVTEGIEIGKEEGIKEGIKQVVQNMIAKGKSNEDIMDATDLTLEEVEALRLSV